MHQVLQYQYLVKINMKIDFAVLIIKMKFCFLAIPMTVLYVIFTPLIPNICFLFSKFPDYIIIKTY